jgi:RNA polymerase-binding transcription factor DksA
MPETEQTKEQLLKWRDKINEHLNKVNESERIELDNDLQEQSIQTEQEEVAVLMEVNLRKELVAIEDQLLDFESE